MIAQVKNKVKDFVITLEIRGKKHYYMVKVHEKIQMETNLKKLIAMAAGQDRGCFDENSISPDVRARVDGALDSIFRGKSILVWTRGGKLSAAWDTAMNELRDEIFAIKNTAPIVEYLRVAVFALRGRWQSKMLQSNERNSIVDGASDAELNDLKSYAVSLIESGTRVINDLISVGVSGGAQRGIQNTMSMNMEHVNMLEHEYERVRKR